MQNNASFLAMPEHPCMITRLIDEMREAFREFREDPQAYVKGVIKGDASGGQRRTTMFRMGLAIGILFYAIVFAAILVFWSMSRQSQSGARQLAIYVLKTPIYSPKARMPEAEDKSGGGGGGGRNSSELPSKGSLPIFSLTKLIVAPRPENPLTPPVLPFIETVKVDPRIQVDRDDLMPTGLPDGAAILPSAGPGTGGGIGTGSRGGIGSGDGYGVGPGRGEGIGGGEPGIGGKPKATIRQEAVDERPVLLNQPRPFYTEEARRNKVQGVVRVRILIEASGAVKEVVVMRGLPDGLNEQAIRAAYQMRFRPAMKNGQPVVYWLNNVEVEFNLR
jgi:periplasmic protein TonB